MSEEESRAQGEEAARQRSRPYTPQPQLEAPLALPRFIRVGELDGPPHYPAYPGDDADMDVVSAEFKALTKHVDAENRGPSSRGD